MQDKLAQDDINLLKEAVGQGRIGPEDGPVEIFSCFRGDRERIEIRPYDFKRPERIGKDLVRSFQRLHEPFARSFGAALSGYLRTIVEVQVSGASQMSYSEFVDELPNPTSFSILGCSPLEGQACLQLDSEVLFPVIDRLLGGGSDSSHIPDRPMTEIESRLARQLITRATTSLSESWQGFRPMEFTLEASETNPQLAQIVSPNEVVIVIGFSFKMAGSHGSMKFCIPFKVIQPMIEELSARNWFASSDEASKHEVSPTISRVLQETPVQLTSTLAETTITLSELRGLEVGDVITTGKPASSPLTVQVHEQTKFKAHIGQVRGNRALRII